MKFKIKHIETGKIYSNPLEIIEDRNLENINLNLNIRPCVFDMGRLAITNDGQILMLGNCGEIIYLDEKQFEINIEKD